MKNYMLPFWVLLLVCAACHKEDQPKLTKFKIPVDKGSGVVVQNISPTPDGYILGRNTSSGGSYNADVIYVDKDGNIQSANLLMKDGYLNGMIPAQNGEVIAVGTSYIPSSPFISNMARLDSKGQTIWKKNIPANLPAELALTNQGPWSVAETSDKRLVIVVDLYNSTISNAILCFDQQGNFLWQKTLPGENVLTAQLVTSKDGSVIIKYKNWDASNQIYKVHITRLDKNGNTLWTKLIQESAQDYSTMTMIGDEVFFMVSNVGAVSASLYKVNTNGEYSLVKNLVGVGYSGRLFETHDNNLIFLGYWSSSTAVMVKMKPDGTEIFRKNLPGGIYDAAKCPDGGFAILDENYFYKTDEDGNWE
jgi:hypothetical protein